MTKSIQREWKVSEFLSSGKVVDRKREFIKDREAILKTLHLKSWYIHGIFIFLVALVSFVFNQAPFVFSSKPFSIGNDGDSALHVSIQMKLRDPTLFSKDVELNEMFIPSRPTFELFFHRIVIWIAEQFYDGNLFSANIMLFWIYHLFFIAGCYLLGWAVHKSYAIGVLFSAASIGLSLAFVAWWGMRYGAVIPHDVALSLTPWFVLGYLHWIRHPRRLVALFLGLGVAVNLYPLQPTYIAVILLISIFWRRRYPFTYTLILGFAFLLGAMPSILTSATEAFEKMARVYPSEKAMIDALFLKHYGYLFLPSFGRIIRLILKSPICGFLILSSIALYFKKRKVGLTEMDRGLFPFTLWTLVIGLMGLVAGMIYHPLILFLFHRASAFLYIPAYLNCLWLAKHWIQRPTAYRLAAGGILILAILFNGFRNTTLSYYLQGFQYMQSSPPYYQLAQWAAENTPQNSLFLVPFGERKSFYAFRVYSERSVLLHWVTGETVLSNPKIGTLFWNMANDIIPLYNKKVDTTEFVRIAKKYDVDYIVNDRSTPSQPNLPIVYQNETYIVFVVSPNNP